MKFLWLLIPLAAFAAWFFILRKDNMSPLRIALPSIHLESDPHIMEDINSMFLVQQIHRSLFRFSSDGTIYPDLADKIEFSSQGTVMKIWLRPGETFSDGSPITAREVVASLKRPFEVGAGIAADLAYIEGGEQALKKKNGDMLAIQQLGPLELSIRMPRAVELLSTHLALPDLSILKIGLDGKWDKTATSGSYRMSAISANEIRLSPRKASGREVILIAVPSENAFQAAFDGAVDSVEVYSFTPREIEQLAQKGWSSSVHSLSYENFLLMNPARLSVELRAVIADTVRSEKLTPVIGQGMRNAFGLIPPNLEGALEKPYIYQSPASKAAVGQFDLHFNKNNGHHKIAAEWIAKTLGARGIKVTLSPLEQDDFYGHLLKRKSAAIIAGKGLDYPDGLANLTYFRTDVSNHFLFMENSHLDKALSQLAFTPTAKKPEVYREIQRQILEQKTVVPLYFGHTTSGMWSGRVKSVPSHPFGFQFLKLEEIE